MVNLVKPENKVLFERASHVRDNQSYRGGECSSKTLGLAKFKLNYSGLAISFFLAVMCV